MAVAAATAAVAPFAAPRAAAAQTIRDEAEQAERPEVTAVRFVGVKAVDQDELAEALATKASTCLNLIFRFTICPFSKSPYVYERRYLDRTELARDVVRLLVFYYKRGWRDAAVDTAVTRAGRDEVRVTFTVTERAPTLVRRLDIEEVGREVPPRGLARRMRPSPGEPLNLLALDSALARAREAYWERGYGDVAVERPAIAVDDSADTAAVRVVVRRGPRTPIGSIAVVHVGPQREVSEETIRRSLTIEPGDLFRRSDVARSQRALYESGLFRSALIDTAAVTDRETGGAVCAQRTSAAGSSPLLPRGAVPTAGDSAKHLVVCVTEAPLREVRTSAGFSTADFVQVEGRFTHNYWLGGARRLDVSGAVGNLGAEQLFATFPFNLGNGFNVNSDAQNAQARAGRYFAPTYQVGADVRQRWFGSPRNTIGTGVFLSRRASPGVFVDRGQGANVAFTRVVAERIPVSATYRFEVSRVEAGDVYFCVNFGVCDVATVRALQGQQRLSPVALTASINRTDDPLFPRRGILARFEAEHASRFTASDFRFNRLTAEASTYRRIALRGGSVVAGRVRAGWVDALAGTNAAVGVSRAAIDGGREILHPRTRFYAGGSRSVRGFGENQLGPRVLTVDPNALRGRTITGTDTTYASGAGCAPPGDLRACFAARRDSLTDDQFTPRPLGGTTVLEGNVELRFPVWQQLWGAVFVDGAVLGERSLGDIAGGTGAITPGFGVRYISPVGPVRVDVGFRPTLVERFPVVTETVDSTGTRRLVPLGVDGACRNASGRDGCRGFPLAGASGVRGFLNRITLHLSIGEAF